MNRAERRSGVGPANRAGWLFEVEPLGGRTIATSALYGQGHFQRTGAGQIRNDVLRIHNFNVVIARDIARRHRTWPGLE